MINEAMAECEQLSFDEAEQQAQQEVNETLLEQIEQTEEQQDDNQSSKQGEQNELIASLQANQEAQFDQERSISDQKSNYEE